MVPAPVVVQDEPAPDESAGDSVDRGTYVAPKPGNIKFLPVSEADQDLAFKAFLDQLVSDIANRDVDAVAAIAHPEIKLSFGGVHDGRDGFRQQLESNSEFGGVIYWQELERVLQLGGVFEGPEVYCTPYVFCVDIPGCVGCDPYATLGRGQRTCAGLRGTGRERGGDCRTGL